MHAWMAEICGDRITCKVNAPMATIAPQCSNRTIDLTNNVSSDREAAITDSRFMWPITAPLGSISRRRPRQPRRNKRLHPISAYRGAAPQPPARLKKFHVHADEATHWDMLHACVRSMSPANSARRFTSPSRTNSFMASAFGNTTTNGGGRTHSLQRPTR